MVISGDRVAQLRAQQVLKLAESKVQPPASLISCDPQKERLKDFLASREPLVELIARGESGYSLVVALIDKARQNPLNNLGGFDGAGDASMKAYWDTTLRAATLLAAAGRSQKLLVDVTRVSPSSDEGIILIFGTDLAEHTRLQFKEAWVLARQTLDLRSYKYSVDVPYNGGSERFDLDLDGFSRVLRHPELVVACSHSLSLPISIAGAPAGFIAEQIRQLEDEELSFRDLLPPAFQSRGEGMAEVKTGFTTNLRAMGVESLPNGSYVEIKLNPPYEQSLALLACVDDRAQPRAWGTRKGYAEIFSGHFGMRGFNTFMGKAQSNGLLTPVAEAMMDITTLGIKVVPTSNGYLQYWTDLGANDISARAIKNLIRHRLHDRGVTDFEPEVTLIDAKGVDLKEVRARFILASMGVDLPHYVLVRTDFLLNFLENVNPRIQQGIFGSLAFGENRKALTAADAERLKMVRHICSVRRTIRDTEDLIWTLRNDAALPLEIRAIKKDLEEWIFEFATKNYERMAYLLAQKVDAEVRVRSTRNSVP